MLFTDSPPAPLSKQSRTCVSYEQNGFPFATITNKTIVSQIIKQAVPDIYQEGDENRFWKL